VNFTYRDIKGALPRGEIDLESDDIRVLLVRVGSSAATEKDANTLAAFSDLREFDGTLYARVPLAGQAVTENAPEDRWEFDADDADFGVLGPGSGQIAAAILYKHVGADAANVPIAYIDSVSAGAPFPFTPSGVTTIEWDPAGILHFR
jgi:hypothetical protein